MHPASPVRLRPALREDVATIVRLLADDGLGAGREVIADPPPGAYFDAFEEILINPQTLLAVAEDGSGMVIGTFQMSFMRGLSNQGAKFALVKAVRVASSVRGQGVGQAMMQWAMDEARRRGCRHIELFTHLSRTKAQRFYERLGFEKSHAGMRRAL